MPTLKIYRSGQEVPEDRYMKAGFLYVIKPTHANVYKIGETDNLDRRLIQIKRKFNFDLEYVYTHKTRDCAALEDHLHLRYSKYHIGGDWFALTDEALQDLVKYTEVAK
jgi:hypothetical protein